ncbi:MAG: Stp1/IreP family PP2C-type Ser/Thr phosphatase [Firmicutes bacterium]|nr:Stp1/IreP family PP2C-type Ser/Thr phosphatase [Bacillota bacterium]
MQVAGMTNQGLERARNEDNYFVSAEADIALLAVADGMGGHRAGNIASALAIAAAEKIWLAIDRSNMPTVENARKLIETLLVEANSKIIDESESASERRGMGTTLTAGLLCSNRLTIGHVGDSRAYMINNGQISMITKDHSLLEQLIDTGQVKPEEADNHPQRHVLTRALGVSPDLAIDVTELEIEPGSALILCTDGLTNMVRDNEILAMYKENRDPETLAQALIELANSRGGFDNITVVIATGIGGPQD